MRQETDGVLLESYLIYEPEHQATWFKEDQPLLGALDFDEKYQVLKHICRGVLYCMKHESIYENIRYLSYKFLIAVHSHF